MLMKRIIQCKNNCSLLICATALCLLLNSSCNSNKKKEEILFQSLSSDRTGIHFSNQLTPTPQFNLFSYMYYYNGAGVAAADFNNDGLIDLFFTANQGNNQLYLNKGNLQFQDVTAAATIPQDKGWSTGASVVDINNDGLLDIYVCKVGQYKMLKGKNQLLVCKGINAQGVPYYTDEAKEYGLDFSGFSTQAAFFDYDGDGDLDMFLLNHSVNHDGNYAPRNKFINTYDSLAGQKLYRNETVKNAFGKMPVRFTDVTGQCGINSSKIGYGLGVAVADINLDGWPDLYVGNDFHEDDYLYINQKNGTFAEEGSKRMMHTSQFSMGVDVADVNNDAYPEIISMDMLPYDPYMLRRSLAEDDYNIFQQKISYGYTYQYARNNLQVNRRNGLFSEAAQYAGIHATDWSWAALWMDFDNNGRKDLFISNGIPKRMNDIDYINFVSDAELQQKLRTNTIEQKDILLTNKFPEIKLPNQFFINNGNFKFKDVSNTVDKNQPSFSNGSVYADLDNDGDLDIVVNNINDPVLVYENKTNNKQKKPYASVKLKGPEDNINAIGASIVLFANGGIRTYENNPVHGFLSSMTGPVHIGLDRTVIDSAFVIWPDRSYQKIELKANVQQTFTYTGNLPAFKYQLITGFQPNKTLVAEDITSTTGINYIHQENPFNEFDREPLIPHMVSTEGPALAVADINHDGLEDIFIGASKTYHSAVYLQTAAGKFVQQPQPDMKPDSMYEHIDAVWADVNNDTHPDLLIATGGNEYYSKDVHLLPLLYLNDGKGILSKKENVFADIAVTQSTIAPYDFTGDGFVDLFIGGRAEPWNYGATPHSYLLQNDGKGKFTDVTEKYAKELMMPGMVTNAVWFDMDKDTDKDLLLCYEWGGVDVLINNTNRFTKKTITNQKGWWNFILPFDADNDGDIDLIAGNLGLNTKLKPTNEEPVSLYHNDFDDNGRKEQVLTYYIGGKEIPFAAKQTIERQLPFIKKKFLYAADFAKADLPSLFGADKLKQANKLTANNFSNAILINNGNMQFTISELPFETQLTTYRTAVTVNANNDNLPDIFMMGNYYDNNVEIGRCDADFGTLLINKGKGEFDYQMLNGLAVKGQVRHMQPITINKQTAYILARNNDAPVVFKFK
jgi:enediyne biosynthesis protein E4